MYASSVSTIIVPALPNVNVEVDVVAYLSPVYPDVPEVPEVPAVPLEPEVPLTADVATNISWLLANPVVPVPADDTNVTGIVQ